MGPYRIYVRPATGSPLLEVGTEDTEAAAVQTANIHFAQLRGRWAKAVVIVLDALGRIVTERQ